MDVSILISMVGRFLFTMKLQRPSLGIETQEECVSFEVFSKVCNFG